MPHFVVNVRCDSKNIYMEAIGQNHNGVMQLLKGWLVKNGCEEMTTEKDTLIRGVVMKYKAGVAKSVKTKGVFPIIGSHMGSGPTSGFESNGIRALPALGLLLRRTWVGNEEQ